MGELKRGGVLLWAAVFELSFLLTDLDKRSWRPQAAWGAIFDVYFVLLVFSLLLMQCGIHIESTSFPI